MTENLDSIIEIRSRAQIDQNWREAENHIDEFIEICIEGSPKTEWERFLIRKACAIVSAECILRMKNRLKDDVPN